MDLGNSIKDLVGGFSHSIFDETFKLVNNSVTLSINGPVWNSIWGSIEGLFFDFKRLK